MLERLCRELASEALTLRKEAKSIPDVGAGLRGDVEVLKQQVDCLEAVVWTSVHEFILTGVLRDEILSDRNFEATARERLAAFISFTTVSFEGIGLVLLEAIT